MSLFGKLLVKTGYDGYDVAGNFLRKGVAARSNQFLPFFSTRADRNRLTISHTLGASSIIK